MSFYENSNMVDDLSTESKGADAPAAMLGGEVAAPVNPAVPGMGQGSPAVVTNDHRPKLADPTQAPPASAAPRSPLADDAITEAARSPFAADVSPYGSHVGVGVQRAAESKGKTAEEAKAIGAEWVTNFAHFGVPEAHIDHLVGAGLQVADKPADADTRSAWAAEAQDRLRGTYGGADGASRALAEARAWVALHPKLVAFLDRTGLGSHPRVVEAIAATAHQARKDGKLTK